MATKKPCQVVYSLPKSLSQDEQIGCLGRPMRPCRKKCPGPNSMNNFFVRVTKFFGHRVSRIGGLQGVLGNFIRMGFTDAYGRFSPNPQ